MSTDRWAGAARQALGGGRRLDAVERLTGGSRKGAYRLTMDDATTAIAYVWSDSESYWPATDGADDLADPFSAGIGGLDVFVAGHARLSAMGVGVPRIHLVDRDRVHYPADLAIVEDFPGEDLEERFDRDPRAAEPTMARLAQTLETMRSCRAPAFGRVAHVDAGGTAQDPSCEQAALRFALRCLAEASARDQRVADARDRLQERLHELTAAVRPRAEYSVVHGELWGHVMIGPDGEPVLIDIDDLKYFDVEWEHVYLRIRMHGDYPRLAVPGLDEDRLALYMLTQRLSLTAGPLQLIEQGVPDPAFMRSVAEYNLEQALSWVSAR
ncbi:phosphotransferase family protein [Actinoplanes sp. HUAS TT8]|uniref:phosphotransferase family protein n=1 Tax=Actinoplanes sp. HUAS TT8 TaxID=3447453 RepID=UPI003F5271E1